MRSIYADWERGDYFSRADWADPQIEFVLADGPEPGRWIGLAEMADAWRRVLSVWQDHRAGVEQFRELDDGRVLVLDGVSVRGRGSGVELAGPWTRTASLFEVRDGKVTRLVTYFSRDRAFADLGLAAEESRDPY